MTPRERVELCMAVDELTTSYAKLLSFKMKVQDGEVLEPFELQNLADLACDMSALMDKVNCLEEVCGYESVGIPITDGVMNFHGFSIQNGELVGDLSYAYQVAAPWYCAFYKGERTEVSDFFKFFTASFIIYLTDMYWPEVVEKINNPKKKRVGGSVFGWLSSFFFKKKKGA